MGATSTALTAVGRRSLGALPTAGSLGLTLSACCLPHDMLDPVCLRSEASSIAPGALEAGLLVSLLLLTLHAEELLPEVLLPLQLLLFLLLLRSQVLFVVQVPLLLGLPHLLTVHRAQGVQQRPDLPLVRLPDDGWSHSVLWHLACLRLSLGLILKWQGLLQGLGNVQRVEMLPLPQDWLIQESLFGFSLMPCASLS